MQKTPDSCWRIFCVLVAMAAVANTGWAQAHPGDSLARVISSEPFEMPAGAEQAGIAGPVRVSATIGADGEVKNVEIAAGPGWPCGTSPVKEIAAVREAVRKNVMAAKFAPTVKSGKPREDKVLLTFPVGTAQIALKEKEFTRTVKVGKPPILLDVGTVNGKAISLPKPEYPPEARRERVMGTVPIRVVIGEDGNVILAGTVDGHWLLQGSSRNAACGGKFSPTLINGTPVKVTGVLVYNFSVR